MASLKDTLIEDNEKPKLYDCHSKIKDENEKNEQETECKVEVNDSEAVEDFQCTTIKEEIDETLDCEEKILVSNETVDVVSEPIVGYQMNILKLLKAEPEEIDVEENANLINNEPLKIESEEIHIKEESESENNDSAHEYEVENDTYKNSMWSHTEEYKFCQKSFSQNSRLKTHILIHTGEKNYKCEICNKVFTHNSSLKTHSLIYTEAKEFKCTICPKSFSQNKSETEDSGNTEEDFEDVTYKNLSGNHTDEQVLKYQIGKKTLFRKFKLNQYREKKNICEFCGKTFSRSWSLKRHLLTHAGKKSYKCEISQKSVTKCLSLINHEKIHTGEIKRKPRKKYECEICQKSFTYGNLKKHMKIHTGEKKHDCKICGKIFSRNGNLKVHLVSHTGEKPFECRICGKTFSQKAYLRTHLVIHTGEKKYKCKICQNTFSQGAHLRAHLVTHTGEKKYQCEICGKAVSSNTELNRHLLLHTGVKK